MNISDQSRIDDRRRNGTDKRAAERRKAELARRRSPRMRTLKGGRIIASSGSSIRCTVRNISETGALLELQSPTFLAQNIELVFEDPEWVPRVCRVVWRDGALMGVEFATPEPEGGPIRRALQKLLNRG
jgi:hypothetical protein